MQVGNEREIDARWIFFIIFYFYFFKFKEIVKRTKDFFKTLRALMFEAEKNVCSHKPKLY